MTLKVVGEVQYGPETREQWRKRLITKLNEKFEEMNSCSKQSDEHKNYFC